jgi:hypothetical protein
MQYVEAFAKVSWAGIAQESAEVKGFLDGKAGCTAMTVN